MSFLIPQNKKLYQQAQFFKSNKDTTAVFSDFDGTIVSITKIHSDINVPSDILDALRDISRQYALLGFVSGRTVNELTRYIGVEDAVYIGNHGLQVITNNGLKEKVTPEKKAKIRESLKRLSRESLLNEEGIFVENKELSASIHFRQRPELKSQIVSLVEGIAGELELFTLPGRKVIEIRPEPETNKGTSILEILKENTQIKNTVCLGDDVTDIYAFRSLKEWGKNSGRSSLNIGISSAETDLEAEESIDVIIEDQKKVGLFLKYLVE